MDDYRVKLAAEGTTIEGFNGSFKMRVRKNVKLTDDTNVAVMEATLYKENGSFIPTGSYLFEALDSQDMPVSEVDTDEFGRAIDFFFTSLLDTENYIKSIPRASSLCNPEMKAFKFD